MWMFAHVAIKHSYCKYIFLFKYKEMEVRWGVNTFSQYCMLFKNTVWVLQKELISNKIHGGLSV